MPLRSADIETLYKLHRAEVLGYLARRCPEGSAQDLLQETFLQAMRQAERSEAITTPRAWIFGIARHVLARHYRNHPDIENGPILAQLDGNEERQDERVGRMREAIGQLPLELREPLELRIGQELSYEEIANVLQMPIGTVRSRLHHAVRRLRAALGGPEKNL